MANDSPTFARGFLHRRLGAPIKAQLTQGITPDKIALTIAIGLVCGIFPFLGLTTLLCFLVAWMLRLNQPIIHLVNQLLWPVHLPCILLYVRFGERIFGAPKVRFNLRHLPQLVEDLRHDPVDFLHRFGMTGLHALTAWTITAPFFIAALYFILRPFLRTVTAAVKRPPSAKSPAG